MSKLSKVSALWMIVFFLGLAGTGFAENDAGEGLVSENEKTVVAEAQEKNGEKVVLGDIFVRETRKGESAAIDGISAHRLKELGHDATIITGEELDAAGFVDLAKALQTLVPGLYSSTSQGRGGYNIMRIHGSNEILWLLDGVRINAIHGALSHPWSYSISVHMIDRIEVLKGGEGLFYGTGARGGVINIITKGISEETSGELGMSYGEDDYRDIYGHVTETINDHGFMVFGTQEQYDGYHVLDDQAYEDALNPYNNKRIGSDRSTIGVKYRKGFDLAGESSLNAQFRRQQGYFDYPNPQYRRADFVWNEEVGTVTWDHDTSDTFSYHIKTYYHKWWAELTQMNIDGSFVFEEEPVKCDAYGLNILTSTRWGEGHEFISGIDYRNYWGSFEWFYGHDFDRTEDYGLFASYRPYLVFSPKTRLTMSARHTRTKEDADSTIWDISVRTPIVGPTYIRGCVRTDFTLPTLGQLSGDVPAWGIISNPDLEPEESLDMQVGVGGNWRFVHCEAGYFSSDVDNLIQSVILGSGDETYENVDGETSIDGFEISAGFGPFWGFTFDVSAVWTNAEDKDTGEQLEQIPEFNGTASIGYRTNSNRFGANLMSRYTGDVYERGLGTHEDINYGDYFVADASAYVSFGHELRHKLTLRIENIFDEDYANSWARTQNTSGDYFVYKQYGLPRNVVMGYTYTF